MWKYCCYFSLSKLHSLNSLGDSVECPTEGGIFLIKIVHIQQFIKCIEFSHFPGNLNFSLNISTLRNVSCWRALRAWAFRCRPWWNRMIYTFSIKYHNFNTRMEFPKRIFIFFDDWSIEILIWSFPIHSQRTWNWWEWAWGNGNEDDYDIFWSMQQFKKNKKCFMTWDYLNLNWYY